jgi:hypothetical protein
MFSSKAIVLLSRRPIRYAKANSGTRFTCLSGFAGGLSFFFLLLFGDGLNVNLTPAFTKKTG